MHLLLPFRIHIPLSSHIIYFITYFLSLHNYSPSASFHHIISISFSMETKDEENVRYVEEYVLNSRGIKLFTCSWVPVHQEPKALIFICHGYAMECSITMSSTAIRLTKAGYGCYGMDYQGHGKSAGLNGYIENFDDIIEDCTNHYSSICEKQENKGKLRYLLGESMGGAVVLLLHRKKPQFWDGAILAAPMCKIASDLKPSPVMVSVLEKLCKFIPTWRIIPTQDIVDLAFKEPSIRQTVRDNQYCYKGRPRLKTGYELQRVCMELEKRLDEVTLSFLVLHGEADRVTDKTVSKQMWEMASSQDKTLKLYPDMWHGLLYGEPESNVDIVFADIIAWLEKRTSMGNSRLERELKQGCDVSTSDSKSQ